MSNSTPFLDIPAFRDALPDKGALLGLDLGSKTIGLAIADPRWQVASPVETLKRAKFTAAANDLRAVITERNIQGLVFGWPLNMDGSAGPRCQATADFARNLKTAGIALPCFAQDERLSSAVVERILIREQDMTRARRAQVVDKMAAAYLLQGALDRLAL